MGTSCQGSTILIIDDDQNIINLLDQFLSEQNINTISSINGMEGFALAKTVRPDLILLDIRMPSMDGFETCRKLKADEATGNIH